ERGVQRSNHEAPEQQVDEGEEDRYQRRGGEPRALDVEEHVQQDAERDSEPGAPRAEVRRRRGASVQRVPEPPYYGKQEERHLDGAEVGYDQSGERANRVGEDQDRAGDGRADEVGRELVALHGSFLKAARRRRETARGRGRARAPAL